MGARLYQYKLPFNGPKYREREGLVLQWEDGWGEIAPLPALSKETFAEARAEILSLLPSLSTAKPKLPSVQFGLACASRPFSLAPIRIPLCALSPTSDRLKGFKTIKLKLGALSLEEATALVQSYGHRFRIRADFNRMWPLERILAFASRFKPSDFDYLEDPTQTFEELIYFSQRTHFPLAIDEGIENAPLSKIPSLKALVVKPTIWGTLPQGPPHLDLVLSSSYETGLGLLSIARWAKERNLQREAGLDTVHYLPQDLLASPIEASAGFFSWKSDKKPPIDLSKLCLIASAP